MSIWRKGPIDHNPYYRTAFRIGRVGREIVRHKTLVQQIGQTRRIVKTAPEHHVINGRTVTDAELNSAEKILLDPRQRLAEELLHHATEILPLKHLKQLAEEANGLLAAMAAEPPEVQDFTWLDALQSDLCERFLDGERLTEITAGSLELEIIPPFGPDENQGEY